MSRCVRVALAVWFSLAGWNLAHSQDASTNAPAANGPAATPTNATASSADDMAKLQTENAALKKEVADAANTIAELQAQLAQAGVTHQVAPTTEATAPTTNAAPSGPQRALPLDATNANATAAAPGTDAGPSRSYTVVKGDSIWKIAHKMYPGDTKNGVDKIQEANKDAIGNKPLKIGQVLVIPQ